MEEQQAEQPEELEVILVPFRLLINISVHGLLTKSLFISCFLYVDLKSYQPQIGNDGRKSKRYPFRHRCIPKNKTYRRILTRNNNEINPIKKISSRGIHKNHQVSLKLQ